MHALEQKQRQIHLLANIFLNLFIIFGIYIFYLYVLEYRSLLSSENIILISKVLAYFSIFLTIYYVICWGKITGVTFNLFSMFLISFILFTMGQPILFSFNQDPSVNLYLRLPLESIVKAEIYTLICFSSLFVGGLISLYFSKNKGKKMNDFQETNTIFAFRNVGLLLFSLTLLPTIYFMFNNFQLASSVGYGALSGSSSSNIISKIISMMSDYFIISLVLMLIGYKDKKVIVNIINFIAILYSFSYFLLGDRAIPTTIILMVLWFNTNIRKKVNFKSYIKILVLVTALLTLFPIIGDLRTEGLISISELTSNISLNSKEEESNFVVESIGTFGYSMFPLVKTMDIVPEVSPFKFGSSYFFALTTVVPNIFGGQHIGAQNSALAQWLMNILDMNYGPGYSIPAEAYYNFGWFPVPIMILMGILFAKLLTFTTFDKGNYIKLFIILSFFYMNLTAPRAEFLGIVRDVTYYIIPVYLLLLLAINHITLRRKTTCEKTSIHKDI
ncbi:O-antigen polysaccharide polymerase Wzy family protein [Halobacillus shinanisalinarum]|uniref:O-antigen polysaccharide polymerase Wzy family protein n=1 Tax=Halobacillus shinanisalinarum TaxID=2932258 RepID=A0ABY4H7W1_9BACI|nr:O-antigen polysaccharide polymerase Wzy [Halobacillus shinanisalinarum]UOQ95062.1 O-antigen polysaccharide polymerase Wzy family protein [Halobacillus shinanisalinarum]